MIARKLLSLAGRAAWALCIVLALALSAAAQEKSARSTGPWDMARLKTPPKFTWGKPSGIVRELYYSGEPLHGKPTRVFAYYARPKQGAGPFPAMLLIHGGGGQAFAHWAELWANRGYAALAMDTAGQGPDKIRLEDGGPDQDLTTKFADFNDADIKNMWTYHAVADVLLGHSLLASFPEVDRQRIGVTGISWGGYLTCLVTGVDDRVRVSVPVYGCGYLADNSSWSDLLAEMTPQRRERWMRLFDPSSYLAGIRCPILFVNGTNDKSYRLDIYQKSYQAVSGEVALCVRVGMKHSHPEGWAPVEIGLFVDSVLRGGIPLAKIEPMQTEGYRVSAAFSTQVPLESGQLHYTSDSGPWPARVWKSVPAKLAESHIEATLPAARPLVYYLSITDQRHALVSTPYATLLESGK